MKNIKYPEIKIDLSCAACFWCTRPISDVALYKIHPRVDVTTPILGVII